MLKNLSLYFRGLSQKPKFILLAVGVQLFFGFFVFPHMQQIIDPNNLNPMLDLRFGYSTTKAYSVLETYGQVGREAYLLSCGLFDMLYPMVYAIAFSLILSLFFQNAFSENNILQNFNIFPFLIALADYAENFGIVTMLVNFPKTLDWAAQLASEAGLVKWSAVIFNLILLFTGLFGWMFRNIFRRNAR